jgi:hypothetical protein
MPKDIIASIKGIVSRYMLSKDLNYQVADPASEILARLFFTDGNFKENSRRVTLPTSAKKTVEQVTTTLKWMCDPSKHKGQQAAEIAAKTLRGLTTGSLSGQSLLSLRTKFMSCRTKHIRHKAARAQRVPECIIPLSDGFQSRRLVSEEEIDSTGRIMQNCLARSEYAKFYKKSVRERKVELVVIEEFHGGSAKPSIRALLRIDLKENCLLEVKGVHNERPIKYRGQIIDFLRHRSIDVAELDDALGVAICDGLIKSGQITKINFEGWRFEISQHTVAMIANGSSILFRYVGGSYGIMISAGWNTSAGDADELTAQAQARVFLRQACACNPAFARAIRSAFDDAPDLVVWDWFGGCGRPICSIIAPM